MKLQIGKYTIRSDQYSLWIEEECVNEKTGKKFNRRVAGYAGNWSILTRQFCEHRYKSSDAESVREFLKDMEQTFQDIQMLNEAAVKKDFKLVKKNARERKVK